MAVAAVVPPAGAKSVKVASLPVAFQVKNTNTTNVPCTSDGGTYTVRGHIWAPKRDLTTKRSERLGITLYLHGLGLGEWLWAFPANKRYNHARALAALGHASVTIDRLGYGASDKPLGNAVCIGSQSDVAHQIVAKLKASEYEHGSPQRLAWKKVALVGHSAAGQIAITEAYTYRDVGALGIVSFSFSNLPRGNDEFGFERIVCNQGGLPVTPQRPPQYAFFGQTDAAFRSVMFRSAPKPVQDAAVPLHYPDPCGDNLSLIAAIARQPASVKNVRAHVLVACGRRDVLYAPFGCEGQAERFKGGRTLLVAGAAHGLPLERPWIKARKRFARWLDRYGY